MAITLYVGGKSVYAKKEKSPDKYVLDPTFEAAALASEEHQSHLREFLSERDNERAAKKRKMEQVGRERAGLGA
ncbi:hypothetical protein AO070_19630 [Pseudomonas syringae pv. syringae PD2766]|uniref:hypothetical protein n=1 Tax=Pseudomonas syringae TaxID=317 RepID=UPI000736DCA6|nr:hypothetical protein [Pseudomonas syringae]KTB77029.1 hypothetical protein AO070_19630 [Pseudomonas syringae pv. syringae PD2766]